MVVSAARSRLVRRLLLALAAVLVGLLGAELGLRAAGIGDPFSGEDLVVRWEPTTPFRRDPDPRIGFTLDPGYRGEKVYRSAAGGTLVHRAEVSVSSDGFRGRGLVGRDPTATDATVILGVGDSLTFGVGVADEETYLAELERQLQTRGAVRVLNAGVPAWNLSQEVRWIEERTAGIAPDVILLGFYVNDLEVANTYLTGEFDQLQSLQLDAPPWAALEGGVRARSHLVNLAARWRERRRLAQRHLETYSDLRKLLRDRFADERAPRLLTGYYGRLADHCAANDARCVVVLFPLLDTVHEDPLADVLDVARRAAWD